MKNEEQDVLCVKITFSIIAQILIDQVKCVKMENAIFTQENKHG